MRQRIHTCFKLFISARRKNLGQAKTFTADEFDAVLAYVATRRHALRNRMLILMSFWTGMRVGEIASLSINDVVDPRGIVKAEIRLDASQTKGKHARTVFMPIKLRDELQAYLDLRQNVKMTDPLFITAGRKRFTANVLTQHFYWLFQKAGIAGASSHSMRRTFITTLATKGIGVRVLASLAGH